MRIGAITVATTDEKRKRALEENSRQMEWNERAAKVESHHFNRLIVSVFSAIQHHIVIVWHLIFFFAHTAHVVICKIVRIRSNHALFIIENTNIIFEQLKYFINYSTTHSI